MDGFKSAEEASIYWKEKANEYKNELEAVKRDFQEYEEDSKTLEHELELELQQEIRKNKDLNACVIKLNNENEMLKNKLDTQNQNEIRQHSETSHEISSLKKLTDDLRKYIRELEQKNDDLETAHRQAKQSVEDLIAKFNEALERNVILESELDEKEQLKVLVQRMRDEARDLESELNVKKTQLQVQSVDSNRSVVELVQVPQNPLPRTRTRTTPLSIVNELIRKMGALELKIATYHRKEEV